MPSHHIVGPQTQSAVCEVFSEQVEFSDLLKHWAEVCAALGNPFMFNAEEISFTNRFRCYWASFRSRVPPDMVMAMQRNPDPDQCMGPGRKLIKYSSHGKDHVRPIGASWLGGDSPRANIMRKILVQDDARAHADPQQITPAEAELLMGWGPNCTAEPTVTAAQRLAAIGGGWDLNAVHSILRFSKMSNINPLDTNTKNHTLTPADTIAQSLLVQLRDQIGESKLAVVLSILDLSQQIWCINLLSLNTYNSADYSVLDSGSSKHLSKQTHILDPHDQKSLTGFNGASTWTEGAGYIFIVLQDFRANHIDLHEKHKPLMHQPTSCVLLPPSRSSELNVLNRRTEAVRLWDT